MEYSTIEQLMLRDLQKCITEIAAYATDEQLWLVPDGVNNSGGTLALHLAGNLQHFIGHVLGGTDYRRNREREFSERHLSRSAVIAELELATVAVKNTFVQLQASDPTAVFPDTTFGPDKTIEEILPILMTHLSYHLGQLNYHRRIVGAQR